MRPHAMALLGLVVACFVIGAFWQEDAVSSPKERNLRTFTPSKPSKLQQNLSALLPEPCLAQQMAATTRWIWQCALSFVRAHWQALLLGIALAALGFLLKRYLGTFNDASYKLLQQVTDEDSRGGVDRLISRGSLLYMMALWSSDMFSDIYVAVQYFRSGMNIFGSALVAIWVTSGVLAFVHRYVGWKLCGSDENISYWAQGLNAQGEQRPGFGSFLLYVTQVEPLVMAVKAWKIGLTTELKEEQIITALCEGGPSSLLQVYALLVEGPKGNPWILAGSVALSTLTVAKAVDQAYLLCKPETREFERGLLPPAGLIAFRCCDIFSRIGLWALLGLCLRPRGSKPHGLQQPYLPVIIIGELLIITMMFMSRKFELHLPTSAPFKKKHLLGIMSSFLGLFVCCYERDLQVQNAYARSLVALRAAQALGILWLCALLLPEDHCEPLTGTTLMTLLVTSFSFGVMFVGAVAHDLSMTCWARPIFPVIRGWRGGRLELGARLGLAHVVEIESHDISEHRQDALLSAMCQAAEAGHVRVVQLLSDLGVTAAGALESGETAVHSAARGGHLSVMVTLKDVGSNLEKPSNVGRTPAWIAAENGHLEVLKFLHSCGCNLETPDNNGSTPALIAAKNGHLEALKFLNSCGCNLETANKDGYTPAYIAARNGHLEVLKFLHSCGCNLETPDNVGRTPAYIAARNGHLEVLKFLHSSRCNLETPANNGGTPAYIAAQNGHLEVLKFLHSCRCNLETPDNVGRTPAWVAAQFGHLEVLKFLRDTVSEIGVQSLHAAMKNNHCEVVEFLVGCVDVNAPGYGFVHALDLAQAQGSDGSMEALKRAGAVAGPQLKLQGLTAMRPPVAPPHGAIWFTSGTPELAQSSGKFYYEIEILSDFEGPQCGWLNSNFAGDGDERLGVGDDEHGWSFDGQRHLWFHDNESKALEISSWKVHDILGFAVDFDEGKMHLYTKEGEEASMTFEAHGAL